MTIFFVDFLHAFIFLFYQNGTPPVENNGPSLKGYDYSPRSFCNDATLLCESESDKIWIDEFE